MRERACVSSGLSRPLPLQQLKNVLIWCCLWSPLLADCSPGMTFNGTGTSWSNWCVGCPVGPYCTGGSADNPDATPTQCPTGLATIVVGSKSEAQCYTAPGYGRTTSAAPNGRTVVVVQLCPIGSYNSGGNTAGCQQCGVSLTTVQPGSTNISACGECATVRLRPWSACTYWWHGCS